MKAKSFVLLLVGVLALGGGLGGAFVGGIALGKSQDDEVAQVSLPTRQPSDGGQQSLGPSNGPAITGLRDQAQSGDANQEDLAQLRQRLQSGEATEDDLARLRQQFQGQFGRGDGGTGFTGGGALTGTVERVNGNILTLNTPQGTLRATIGADTTIQKTEAIALEELIEGMRLTVSGARGEDGTVEASSVFVIPEGADGVLGGPGGGFRGGLFGPRGGGGLPPAGGQ